MRKLNFQKTKKAHPTSLSRTRISSNVRRKAISQVVTSIEKMDFDEKIELFQQMEIAQGIRKGEKSVKMLSTVSQDMIRKYEALSSRKDKDIYAEKIKSQIYASLKKSMFDE